MVLDGYSFFLFNILIKKMAVFVPWFVTFKRWVQSDHCWYLQNGYLNMKVALKCVVYMSLYKERQKHFHNSVFCEKLRNQKPWSGRNPSLLHSREGKISNFHSYLPLATPSSLLCDCCRHLRLLSTLHIGISDNAYINFQVFKILTSHGYKFSMLRPRASFHSLQMT